ncbi:MAG: hypothetical protein NW226_02545 [Microscillaceae bacterium]|nr:hypothetical protein [Microscillaceae bacterium]
MLPDTLLLQGAEAFLEIDFRWIIPRGNPCMICLDVSSAGFVCLPYEYFQLFFPLELSREDKINIYQQLIETASKKCSSQALEKLENELSTL